MNRMELNVEEQIADGIKKQPKPREIAYYILGWVRISIEENRFEFPDIAKKKSEIKLSDASLSFLFIIFLPYPLMKRE